MRRCLILAGSLVGLHFLLWAYVVAAGILYDQGGFEGLLWWLVAIPMLPVAAILLLAFGFVGGWLRSRSGEV